MRGPRPKPAVVTRTMKRYAEAVLNLEQLGAIPVWSADHQEQELIDATRSAIELEYRRADLALRRLINR